MTSITKHLRRTSVGGKLSMLILVLQLVGFIGLSFFLSQAAINQLNAEVSQSIERQQSQAADMVSLFDQTLQQEATHLLNLFLADLSPDFALNPRQKIAVVGRQTPALSNGGEQLNGAYDIPDDFTARTGAPVTLFARDGDDFVRVTTSLTKTDGERAVGTQLDRTSRSYSQLMAGQPYSGIAELFGTFYITKYQPILDRSGDVIGASFIGIDITQQLARLQDRVRGMTHDESGYTMIVNGASAQQGQVIAGGPHEGGSLMALQADSGEPAFTALFSAPSGRFDYALASGDTRQRTTYYLAYPDWNWVIASTVFADEVKAGVVTLRNWALLAALLLALGFSGMLYLFQRKLISRPLDTLVSMAQGLAKGDLSQRHDTRREDEIGKLINAMDGIGEGLTRIVGQVRHSTRSVNHAAGEIAQSSHDLSSRTEQSAANLQETSASMEQITATVQNTSHSAQEASQLVKTTAEVARQGSSDMRQAQSTMDDINASAARIGEIITLIDGIAFQTNILALNASVEAARAGEHGRGFAVVAQEVRTLATRSSDASQEIRALIDESLTHTQSGATLVKGAAQTMEKILQGVERVTDMIGEISAGAREQSDGISQINTAVTELDAMTQQNATVVEQSSTAAEEMRNQAQRLEELMASFNLGNHDNLGNHEKSMPAIAPQKRTPPRSAALPSRGRDDSKHRALATDVDDDWDSF